MRRLPKQWNCCPLSNSPIVPNSSISGRALVAVVAIMTFLASLTTGAVLLVRAAASDWQSEVAREITIQLRPISGRDIEADVARAAEVARSFAGVAAVRPYTKDESARLLEPWLGSGLTLSDLPIPRIVVVRISSDAVLDTAALRVQLARIPGASLDDHRGFVDRMRAMAGAVVFGGLAVLILMLTATVFSVTFATRAAMATNRPVIEVLHFVGAKTSFIAGHFQRHFLGLGLRGGLIGGGCALIMFAMAELLTPKILWYCCWRPVRSSIRYVLDWDRGLCLAGDTGRFDRGRDIGQFPLCRQSDAGFDPIETSYNVAICHGSDQIAIMAATSSGAGSFGRLLPASWRQCFCSRLDSRFSSRDYPRTRLRMKAGQTKSWR